MNHESYKPCNRRFANGTHCDSQYSVWMEDDETGTEGRFCTRCGAFRGRSGDEPGRVLLSREQRQAK